jgi:MFS superfamily sulfate permease-like transporter
MDFTPLFNEILKAGPWALVCMLIIWIGYTIATWFKPVVAGVVDAHLTYLKSVADSQSQIHSALDNQTDALVQNNKILDRLDTRLQQHQEEKLSILADHTKMLTMIHENQNHKPVT